ncbi:hypothetical protein Pmani_022758 [Petrolisthes manimaculis]|uniref:Uncharacterized protein n=1 Tax=Petrolisthes manimaculis TaxID=1843537 RepID=A0AAE1U409_9EUCA|nr:hypothetical protein Pmani_022758 [Petrolisthes manimaculis]
MDGWSLVVVSVRWSSNTPTAALHRLAGIYSRQVWPRCDLQKRLVGCGILGSDNFEEFVANFVKFALHSSLESSVLPTVRGRRNSGQQEYRTGGGKGSRDMEQRSNKQEGYMA